MKNTRTRFLIQWLLAAVFMVYGLTGGESDAVAENPATTELIMFEQKACEWCARWNAEIAPVYPKTPEAKCAPFRRVDIHNPQSDILEKIKPIIFTPTFVVMRGGKEVGRVLGYPGEDHFWYLLGLHLKKLGPPCKLPN